MRFVRQVADCRDLQGNVTVWTSCFILGSHCFWRNAAKWLARCEPNGWPLEIDWQIWGVPSSKFVSFDSFESPSISSFVGAVWKPTATSHVQGMWAGFCADHLGIFGLLTVWDVDDFGSINSHRGRAVCPKRRWAPMDGLVGPSQPRQV